MQHYLCLDSNFFRISSLSYLESKFKNELHNGNYSSCVMGSITETTQIDFFITTAPTQQKQTSLFILGIKKQAAWLVFLIFDQIFDDFPCNDEPHDRRHKGGATGDLPLLRAPCFRAFKRL